VSHFNLTLTKEVEPANMPHVLTRANDINRYRLSSVRSNEGIVVRIDPGNSNIPPVPGRKLGRADLRASSSNDSTEKSLDISGSAELIPLLAGLEDVPEVREDLVEEVRQRLNRGEHLTRDAAERTAAAILADLASFIGQ
jgi:hypothetical protein